MWTNNQELNHLDEVVNMNKYCATKMVHTVCSMEVLLPLPPS